MSLVLLTGAAHSPGVTSLAVALAVDWPGPVLLADVSNEPDQAILAGYLQGADPAGQGLARLLEAHRQRRSVAAALPEATLPLTGRPGQDFLPGFPNPAMPALFGPVWAELAATLAAAERPVLADAGRITAAGLPPALLAASAAVVVVTGSRLVDVAGLRLYLPGLVEAVGDRLGLVVVGPGRPYGSGEIGHNLGVPVLGKLAWSPVEAGFYSTGEQARLRPRPSPYRGDVGALRLVLAERLAAVESVGVRP